MPPSTVPRDALRALLVEHLNLAAEAVPDALLNAVLDQVSPWAQAMGPAVPASAPTPTPTAGRKDWSTIQVLMPVVKGWVAARDLEILSDWLEHGARHERLTSVAFQASLDEGWSAGAQRIWASDRLNHGPALVAAWGTRRTPKFDQRWLEPWLETLTWPDPSQPVVGWSSVLNRARSAALTNAWKHQDLDRWNRYVQQGVLANNQTGQALLTAVGRAGDQYPWADAAFQDLVNAKALWSLPMVLDVVMFHREQRLNTLLNAPRLGLDARQRVLLLCQIDLAHANGGLVDPQDAQRVFEACWKEGLPTEARFMAKEVYEALYKDAFVGGAEHVGIALDGLGHRWQAEQAPALKTTGHVLYLADHWGYAQSAQPLAAWRDPAACAARRQAFAQAFEARSLREAFADTPVAEPERPAPARARL